MKLLQELLEIREQSLISEEHDLSTKIKQIAKHAADKADKWLHDEDLETFHSGKRSEKIDIVDDNIDSFFDKYAGDKHSFISSYRKQIISKVVSYLDGFEDAEVSESLITESQLLLLERVDRLLGHIHAVLGNKDGGLEEFDAEELATQMAGLQILGKKDYRDAMDDFAKVDSHGVSKQFFKFLDQVDDPRQSKDFSDKRSADELLKYIATTHGQSVVDNWKSTIEAAQAGDQKALVKIKEGVAKMFQWYQKQYNALKSHFKIGGAFDDLVSAPKENMPNPQEAA